MKHLLALLAVILLAGSAGAESFGSPSGKFRVDYDAGKNAKGSQIKPMRATITPTAGGAAIPLTFRLIQSSDPSVMTVQQAFRWSSDETAVAVEDRPADTRYGFRLVPLGGGLPWKAQSVPAKDLTWVDGGRLVFLGESDEANGLYLAIFVARTGRTYIAHKEMSSATSYEITRVTPTAIAIREETRGMNEDRCFSINTGSGARTDQRCPD